MTGTGTMTDPFVVMTMEELMTMEEWSTDLSYVALGADIDFSDIAEPQPIKMVCREFNGRGHTIRGIYITKPNEKVNILMIKSDQIIAYFDLKNLNIEAEAVAYRFEYIGTVNDKSINTTFTGCNIRIIVHEGTSSGIRLFNNSYITLKYCVISISGTLYAEHETFGKCSLTGCQIIFNLKILGLYSTPYRSMKGIFESAKATDTGFHGIYDKSSIIERIVLFSGAGNFSNCYQAMEYPKCTNVYWDGTIISPCFYDVEKTSAKMIPTNGNTILALTTAQCKDPEYLNSIGFSCEGE